MIPWDPSLATGDAAIDEQHQELFAIVGELHSACVEGNAEECIDAILQRLVSYTNQHFAAEQKLMLRSGYPALDVMDHTSEHSALKRRVDELLEQKARGELTTVLPVAELVHEWLRTHIRKVDARFVAYMHASGTA